MPMRPKSQVLSLDRLIGVQRKIRFHVYVIASLSLASLERSLDRFGGPEVSFIFLFFR